MKGYQKMKKTILLWLAAALLLVGCNSGTGMENDTTSITEEKNAVETETAASGAEYGLTAADYSQADICILSGEHAEYEYMIEEENGEVMNDAVYNRNRSTEEMLNVKLSFISAPNYTQEGMFYTMIRTDVTAGDATYDIINGLNCWTSPLMFEGMFRRMDNISTISLDHPWWVPGLTLDGSDDVYYAFSDASLSLYKDLYVIFFNRTILENNGAANPYDMVKEGKWTIDAFLQMGNEGSVDLNGDGAITVGTDQIAYVAKHAANRAFLTSIDSSLFVIQDNGMPSFSGISERLTNAYDKFRPFLSNPSLAHIDSEADVILLSKPFIEGKSLFLNNCLMAVEGMRDMTDDYGIVPLPKYDEAQNTYHSQIATSSSALYMETTLLEAEMVGHVMEVLGYFSYKDVIPTYYETALNVKYARDTQVQEMLGLVRDNASTNIDFSYNTIFWTNDVMNLAWLDGDLASWIAEKETSVSTTLEKYLAIDIGE